MTEKFTSEQVLAMADRLAKLEVYGACRDGSVMLRAFAATLLSERTAAEEHRRPEPEYSFGPTKGGKVIFKNHDDCMFPVKSSERTAVAVEDAIGHPRRENESRDEIEMFIRDAYASGCHAAQTRSLVTALAYAQREAPNLRRILATTPVDGAPCALCFGRGERTADGSNGRRIRCKNCGGTGIRAALAARGE